MCCSVCAAFTSQVPGAATEQCVPWDRSSPGDCALAASPIPFPRKELGCREANTSKDLAEFGDVHPAVVWAAPRDTGTLSGSSSSHRQPQFLVHAGMGGHPDLGKSGPRQPLDAKAPGLWSLPRHLHSKAKVNNKRITSRTFSLGLVSF